MTDDDFRPLVFLSYSWTSPEYETRVALLAERLHRHEVDLIFDQWDLEAGQDVHAYMEQAVHRADVTNVLILCDPRYAEKANDREGGVGTETLILSPSVYKDVAQRRVIPVIMERDEAGEVVVPIYLEGRRYFDFSIPEKEPDEYEQLVRTLFRKPKRERPSVRGKRPHFLDDSYKPLLTGNSATLFLHSLHANKPSAPGYFADYLDLFLRAFAQQELVELPENGDELAAKSRSSIADFAPYTDEFLTTIRGATRYGPLPGLFSRLHRLFERLIGIRFAHQQRHWQEDAETENLSFLTWELFLSTCAVLIEEDQLEGASVLFQPLHVQLRRHYQARLMGTGILDASYPLLEHQSKQRQRPWRDPAAALLQERAAAAQRPIAGLVEVDVIAWFRTACAQQGDGSDEQMWYPRTLALSEDSGVTPLFNRARNATNFPRVASLIGVATRGEMIQQFKQLPDQYFTDGRGWPNRRRYAQLMGIADEVER